MLKMPFSCQDVCALAQNQNRHGAVRQYMLGFASEQHPFNAFSAMRRHDDKIAIVFCRSRHDGFSHQIRLGKQPGRQRCPAELGSKVCNGHNGL